MNINEHLILTIDLGTSGPKVSVYNAHTDLIDSAFETNQVILKDHGGAEQDTAEWTQSITKAYQTIKARGLFNPKHIRAVNVTAQWSGTVPVDKNGNAIMNAIIWMDSRGAEYAHEVTNGLIKVDGYSVFKMLKWVKLTGGGPTKSGKDSISHILYLKNKLPDIYAKAYKFLEPKDFLNAWISGQICSSFDAITVHWVTDNRDISNIKYSDDLLKMAGVEREKLPDLLPPNSIVGKVSKAFAQAFELDEECVVVSGSPDTHSAAIGSGAVHDFEPHLYIGTSSWLLAHVPFKKTDLLHNMGCIPSSIPGKYLLMNEQECAGNNLNFLKNNILFPKDELNDEDAPKDFYKQLDKMADRIPAGSEGLVYLPWLYGERSPVDDHYARGGFYNMSLNHTRAHFARAIFEGVAFNSRWLLGYAEKMMGQQCKAVRFIGGGANSAVWCQIFADVFDRPIHQVSDPVHANSKGSALLAAVAMKWIDYKDISTLSKVENVYEPNPANKVLYDDRFNTFVKIYNRNKSIFHKLNK